EYAGRKGDGSAYQGAPVQPFAGRRHRGSSGPVPVSHRNRGEPMVRTATSLHAGGPQLRAVDGPLEGLSRGRTRAVTKGSRGRNQILRLPRLRDVAATRMALRDQGMGSHEADRRVARSPQGRITPPPNHR